MFSAQRYNKERHDFGKLGEEEVLPLVEMILGENLTPTEKFYDTMDAESENYWVEIKTRSKTYHWQDKIMKEGWLIPACKIQRALAETEKKVCFYYYWKSDSSLWELEFKPILVADLVPRIPPWHKEKQLHYYIPQDRWTQIEFQQQEQHPSPVQ